MSDVNFDRIIKALQDLHEEFPQMRFGQLLQNALDQEKGLQNVNLNDRSSKDILTCLEKHKENLKQRKNKVMHP